MIPVFASDRAVEVARATPAPRGRARARGRRGPVRDLALARRAGRRRARPRPAARPRTAGRAAPWQPGSSQLLADAQPAGGDRGARFRRPARPAAHPGVPGRAPPRRRGDRPAPRPARHAARQRRIGNRVASLALLAAARTWVPDTQNGMRLFRTDALCATCRCPRAAMTPRAATCARCSRRGHRVASVEIPTIYDGEPSHFHPVRDTAARWAVRWPRRRREPARGRPASAADARGSCAPGRRGWPRSLLAAIALGAGDARVPAARQRALPGHQRARRRARMALPGARPAHAQLHHLLRVTVDRQRDRPAARRATCWAPRSASCSAPILRARRSRW